MILETPFFGRHSSPKIALISSMARRFNSGIAASFRCLWLIPAFLAFLPWLRADDGDWQQWTEASWTQNLGYGLDASFNTEQRWEEDISRFSYFQLEPMINWRYSPRWDFTLGYERDERVKPETEIDNLATAAVLLKVPLKEWYFTNRFRTEWMVPESGQRDWRMIYRNRTGIATQWRVGSKVLVPYLSEEWYYNAQDGEFTQNHLRVGIGAPIAPHWMASVYFMRFDERTADGWQWHPVVGVQVEAQF